MTEKKVFMTNDNKAAFVCPKCQTTKIVDVTQYKDINQAVKVKAHCKCGHVYTILLERRMFFRKPTRLYGEFIFFNGDIEERGLITVSDLSRTGMKFKVSGNPAFKQNDRIQVEFHLDDNQKTLIKKELLVKMIAGMKVGGEFTYLNPDDYYNQKIGFYLFN